MVWNWKRKTRKKKWSFPANNCRSTDRGSFHMNCILRLKKTWIFRFSRDNFTDLWRFVSMAIIYVYFGFIGLKIDCYIRIRSVRYGFLFISRLIRFNSFCPVHDLIANLLSEQFPRSDPISEWMNTNEYLEVRTATEGAYWDFLRENRDTDGDIMWKSESRKIAEFFFLGCL